MPKNLSTRQNPPTADAKVSRCELDGTWVWGDEPCTTCKSREALVSYQ